MSIKIGSTQQKTAEGLYSRQNYTTNAVTRTRRNYHNMPARYLNGVKLSDEEIADVTQHYGRISKVKNERVKMVSSSILKAAAAPHSAPHALPNVASAVRSRATVKTILTEGVSRTT